jgi:hypothetical protein
MNISNDDSYQELCSCCCGTGVREGLDTITMTTIEIKCSHCRGSGIENSSHCNICSGMGYRVNRNNDAYPCTICRGVGRIPNARRRSNTLSENFSRVYDPRMSYEYAPPADIEAIQTPKILKKHNRYQILKQED